MHSLAVLPSRPLFFVQFWDTPQEKWVLDSGLVGLPAFASSSCGSCIRCLRYCVAFTQVLQAIGVVIRASARSSAKVLRPLVTALAMNDLSELLGIQFFIWFTAFA
jgi:hypothetical protein